MPFLILIFVLLLSILIGLIAYPCLWKNKNKINGGDILILFLFGFGVLSIIYGLLGFFNELKLIPFLFCSVVAAIPGVYNIKNICNKFSVSDKKINISWISIVYVLSIPALIIGVYVSTIQPFNWDEISYGLTFAKLHIAAGDIAYLPNYGMYSAFPLFGETVIGIPFLLTGNATSAHFLILVFLIVSLMIVREIYLQFSKSYFFAAICVISVLYLPITMGNIGTAKIEGYQLAYILAAIYALLMSRSESKSSYRLMSYFFMSFAAGIKYTSIFAAPLYIFIYFMSADKKESIAHHFLEFIKLIIIGTVINSVWLMNNWLSVCNPVFPSLINLFGQCGKYPVTSDMMDMVLESTMLQKDMSWATTHSLVNFKKIYLENFGFLNVTLLVLSAGLFFVKRTFENKRFIGWLLIAIALTISFQAFAIYWEFRYTYFIFVFLVIFSLVIIDKNKMGTLIGAAVLIMAVVQAYQSLNQYFKNHVALRLVMDGDVTRDIFADKFIHLYWVSQYINKNTEENSLIAFNWGVQPFFYLDRPFLSIHDWNPEGGFQQIVSSDEFSAIFEKRKIKYLVWRNQDETMYTNPSKTKAFHLRMNNYLDELIKNKFLILQYSQDDVRIFKVANNVLPQR
ncbi:hypothetical protein RGU70_04690 [Herbaspirillum sp. RTI4]|uniref:hypothetical protein n=2 Tax=Herbaspirillum sp. RTI4 TaxID=3048640 RepID=UPI002AB4F316|nr:hypothetical protein [Herbaspirillum sp. RTI4]MDY7577618.1 hypothetical protein [Herbaspirillum sp. RTI4]